MSSEKNLTKKNMHQKGFASLGMIGLLIFLAIIGGYFVLHKPAVAPRSDEIVFWKTYRNAKYNFEVKYPASWQEIVDDCFHSIDHTICFNSGYDQDLVAVVLVSNKSYLDLKDEEIKKINPKIKLEVSEKKIVSNLIPWTELIIKEAGGGVVIDEFFTEYNQKTYTARMKNDMLSTFKFIK